MRNRYTAAILAGTLIVAAFAMTGCYRIDLKEAGDSTIERVRLGSADEVVVELQMGAGDLTVEGGAKDLMEAEFAFSDGRFEPEVDYDVRGGTGTLDIRQPSVRSFLGFDNYRNTWDIQLAEDVPMELNIDMGAGKVDLDLGDVQVTKMTMEAGAGDMALDFSGGRHLRDLRVETGAGELTIDLSGDSWEEDIEAKISAGAGDITVIVPEDIGVRIEVSKGLGEVNVRGFRTAGSDTYENDVYGETDVSIDVTVEAGVGQITLEMR